MAKRFSPFLNFQSFFAFFSFSSAAKAISAHIVSVRVELVQEILWQMPILFDKLFIALFQKRRLVELVITLFINYSRLHNATQGASSSQTLLDM